MTDYDRINTIGNYVINQYPTRFVKIIFDLVIPYLYIEAVLGDKSCVDKIYWCLKSIERLSLSVYEDEKMKNPKVYFKYEPGFFLRDDISVNSKDLFDAFKVESGYSNGIELENEDPCFLLLSHKTKFGTYFHLLH